MAYSAKLDFEGCAGTDKLSPESFAGKAVLVVNTASKCGLTPQLKEMQLVHKRFKAQGLIVLGVPCNDFGGQEPWEEQKIMDFYKSKYGVTFPLAAKVHVRGPNAHPLYAALRKDLGEDALPQWNFHKFLFSGHGDLLGVFGHIIPPTDVEVSEAIEEALAELEMGTANSSNADGQ
ncbi:glutathione peroxidase [Tribonema minus]|uniref:Glutathione peroxidase n=1 Tax=Tribonema minus TaxID=303371 RepID=A0A835YHH5_9STRA|nr:glutathione peroxidase [Tribonema minus]